MLNTPFVSIEYSNESAEWSQEMHDQLKSDWQIDASLHGTRKEGTGAHFGDITESLWFVLVVGPIVSAGMEYLAGLLFDRIGYEIKKRKASKRNSNAYICIEPDPGAMPVEINVEEGKEVFMANFNKIAKPLMAKRKGFKESLYTLLGNNKPKEVLGQLLASLDHKDLSSRELQIKEACLLTQANFERFQQELATNISFEYKLKMNWQLNREVLDVINLLQ
jgi:hypothetical protein